MLLIFSGTQKYKDRRGGKYYRTVMSIGSLRLRRVLKKHHRTASSAIEYGRLLAERYQKLLAAARMVQGAEIMNIIRDNELGGIAMIPLAPDVPVAGFDAFRQEKQ